MQGRTYVALCMTYLMLEVDILDAVSIHGDGFSSFCSHWKNVKPRSQRIVMILYLKRTTTIVNTEYF